jgi:hypothetical protein
VPVSLRRRGWRLPHTWFAILCAFVRMRLPWMIKPLPVPCLCLRICHGWEKCGSVVHAKTLTTEANPAWRAAAGDVVAKMLTGWWVRMGAGGRCITSSPSARSRGSARGSAAVRHGRLDGQHEHEIPCDPYNYENDHQQHKSSNAGSRKCWCRLVLTQTSGEGVSMLQFLAFGAGISVGKRTDSTAQSHKARTGHRQ